MAKPLVPISAMTIKIFIPRIVWKAFKQISSQNKGVWEGSEEEGKVSTSKKKGCHFF